MTRYTYELVMEHHKKYYEPKYWLWLVDVNSDMTVDHFYEQDLMNMNHSRVADVIIDDICDYYDADELDIEQIKTDIVTDVKKFCRMSKYKSERTLDIDIDIDDYVL